MSKKRLLMGVVLIMLVLSIPLLIMLPNLYSNNSTGKIYKKINTDFDFLKNETKPNVLLFFGYIGCNNICLPALSEISKIYEQLDRERFAFYFINLQSSDIEENVDLFAKAFHKDFKGIYLNNEEINTIVKKLNIRYIPSFVDKYEIDHSGFLHVLTKENTIYIQNFLYPARPFNIEHIVKDLKSL